MTINLDTLRKTAEAEETQKWGGWAFEEDDFDGFCIYINDGDNFGRSYVAKDLTQGESEGESTAEFIATFDPPTVLALLSRLEQAERNADTYQKLYEQRAESLEQAEQAVTRVREVLGGYPNEAHGESCEGSYCSNCLIGDLHRALDGDTRG